MKEVQPCHPLAFFTLYPLNDGAREITQLQNNSHLVRRLRTTANNGLDDKVELDLEIRFHISCTSPWTLATIGRDDADILLIGPHFSRIQCSFEIDEIAHEIMLEDRSLSHTTEFFGSSAISFQESHPRRRVVVNENTNLQLGFGGQHCNIAQFSLIWNPHKISILEQVENRVGNPRKNRTMEFPTTNILSACLTRIHTSKDQANVRYIRKGVLGEESYGIVHKALNIESGRYIAVKEIPLPSIENEEQFRRVKREVELHARASHPNIIELLGFEVSQAASKVHIFLPLQDGNLESVKELRLSTNLDNLRQVSYLVYPLAFQMLKALDYLASVKIIHKDVKPENILWTNLPDDSKHYVLADFGLSNIVSQAKAVSGSPPPEVDEMSQFEQTTKIDVWSLFVTIVDVLDLDGFRRKARSSKEERLAAIAAAAEHTAIFELKPMAHEDPTRRASAGQMLDAIYGGQGRTTPAQAIPFQPMTRNLSRLVDSIELEKQRRTPLLEGPAGTQKQQPIDRAQNLHANSALERARRRRFL